MGMHVPARCWQRHTLLTRPVGGAAVRETMRPLLGQLSSTPCVHDAYTEEGKHHPAQVDASDNEAAAGALFYLLLCGRMVTLLLLIPLSNEPAAGRARQNTSTHYPSFREVPGVCSCHVAVQVGRALPLLHDRISQGPLLHAVSTGPAAKAGQENLRLKQRL